MVLVLGKLLMIKGKEKKKKREVRRRHKNTISIGNDLAYYLNMSE